MCIRDRHTQVRMHVDQAGRDPAAGGVDHGGIGRRFKAATHCHHLAVLQQHIAVFQAFAGAGQHGGMADQHWPRGNGAVGAGVGILGEAGAGGGGVRTAAHGSKAGNGQQDKAHGDSPED